MRTLLVCLMGLFFFCGSISAQNDSVSDIHKINYDKRSNLQPVQFDKQQIERYKNDDAFDYSKKVDTINWWQRFIAWLAHIWNSFWQWLLGDIVAGSWLAIVLDVLKYVLIAGLLGLIVWLFIKLNPGRAFLKTKTPPEVLLSEEEKIIHQKDIPALIGEALANNNYRLAVRYHYLFVLKQLKDKNVIDYQVQKTNHDYGTEIADAGLRRQFGNITRLYNFIWYGDFPVNQNEYTIAKTEFERIGPQMKIALDD